jgi:hypothetical protein
MPDKSLFLPCYRDELGPVYSFGAGAAAPSMQALAGGLSAIRGMTFAPGDNIDVAFQINHDILIPAAGNISFDAHVHWTAVAAPAAGATVIWEFEYLGAKPSIDGSSSFPATSTVLTAATHTCDGNEVRKHYLTDMGNIVVPVADYGSSYILWGTFRLKSTSTVALNRVAVLAFDLHKMVQQNGTATEYA